MKRARGRESVNLWGRFKSIIEGGHVYQPKTNVRESSVQRGHPEDVKTQDPILTKANIYNFLVSGANKFSFYRSAFFPFLWWNIQFYIQNTSDKSSISNLTSWQRASQSVKRKQEEETIGSQKALHLTITPLGTKLPTRDSLGNTFKPQPHHSTWLMLDLCQEEKKRGSNYIPQNNPSINYKTVWEGGCRDGSSS